jgi:hypothetical protein
MLQRARRRDVVKEARWRELVATHKTSDLSVRAFCAEQNVPENSFYAWRRELALRDAEGVPAPKKKVRAASNAQRVEGAATRALSQRPTFVPVTFTSPTGLPLVEVTLAQGAVLRVHAGCDAATLAMVLAALEAASC